MGQVLGGFPCGLALCEHGITCGPPENLVIGILLQCSCLATLVLSFRAVLCSLVPPRSYQLALVLCCHGVPFQWVSRGSEGVGMVPDSAIPVCMCSLPVGTYGVVSEAASGLTPFNALCEKVRRPLFSGPHLVLWAHFVHV